MAMFTVSAIIDGDTFEVSGGWKWQGRAGSLVRPIDYDAPELSLKAGLLAKAKLSTLILGKEIELVSVKTTDRGRLVCDVFYNGHRLADYFASDQV